MRVRCFTHSTVILLGLLACLATGIGYAQSTQPTEPAPMTWRETSTPAEQALDAAAFQGLDAALSTQFTDVQSAVVVLRGRVVYRFYRDGEPEKLRDTQSASKSALSALLGTAIAQGRITSVDQRVVDLVPEWAPLNADPRAATITLRHLLSLTAGFALDSGPRTRSGTAAPLPVREAWARPLAADPGQTFAYDNSVTPLLVAVLEKATGMPLADYARQQLVGPMGFAEPSYRGSIVHLRTLDMAKLLVAHGSPLNASHSPFASAVGVLQVVIEHWGFEHGHGRENRTGLRAGGAHLDDALAGGGNIGVFLAKLAVGEDLHFIFAIGKFGKILAEKVHADGFRLALGLHARDLDDGLGFSCLGKTKGHAANKAQSNKQCYDTFHPVNLLASKT